MANAEVDDLVSTFVIVASSVLVVGYLTGAFAEPVPTVMPIGLSFVVVLELVRFNHRYPPGTALSVYRGDR